ncbi:30S ribosomal protein S5 [Candidatus Parcubacteria bacterium]|nr:30S ribosomal protein S5 [Candidatus Parcubacteria bacterium]MBI4098966.1 30S ribosomal protein S5 [Candidatus Parcubacteria bacterium]
MPRFTARREKPEFDHTVLDVRRVARVVAGGRRFSFRATVVVGNRRGMVGVGIGKGPDVSKAIEKATHQAKKRLLSVPLTVRGSIDYEVMAKFSSAKVYLRPAGEGRGIIAGSSVRAICSLAGIGNITAKILSRSTNKLNIARATMAALGQLKPRR